MAQQNPIMVKSISELNDYCIKNNKSIKVKKGLIVGFYAVNPKLIKSKEHIDLEITNRRNQELSKKRFFGWD